MTALTQGQTPRANNDAMLKVYRVAADYDLPVLLHSNITSKDVAQAIAQDNFRALLPKQQRQ